MSKTFRAVDFGEIQLTIDIFMENLLDFEENVFKKHKRE